MKRRMISFFTLLLVLFTMSGTALAQDAGTFLDVGDDHWAKSAIDLMAEKGIISGYNGYFRPQDTVSRAEFAKMLVKTLALGEVKPSTPYFQDVPMSHWSYVYVESARSYLTGFTSGTGYKFKPDEASVREDMAVAVVKGLFDKGQIGDPDATDMSVLDRFGDKGQISLNLRKYVAAAANEGIMVGSDGKFNPMGNLTRAEAATLLARLIDEEEKVVFEDDKVVVGDETVGETVTEQPVVTAQDRTPSLQADVREGDVKLTWSQTASAGFKYYKVVLSEGDSTPQYSENGYARAISNVGSTVWELESGQSYNGGDMNGVIKGGKTYYVAITAVYEDGKFTSNVKRVTVPGTYQEVSSADKTPTLNYTKTDKGILLDWTQVPSSGFSYYKVVLSQTKEKPYYPDYGYLTYISNSAETSYLVKEGLHYNDGKLGGIGGYVEDEGYYMTITAVFSDGKYTSNSIWVSVPDL